jgi:hypothetical protein
MAFTFPIQYGNLVHAQILSGKRLWTHCNNMFEIPDAAAAGALTIKTLTAGTATTVAESTAVANDTENVAVNLTLLPVQVTHTCLPTQTASYYQNPYNLARIAENHADAIEYAADGLILGSAYAATAGDTETLAAGLGNFELGTAAQNLVHLSAATNAVSYLFTQRQDATPDDFVMVMYYKAWGNFTAIRETGAPGPVLNNLTGAYTFMGIPVISTAYATEFGIASRPCAYLWHKDAQCCAFKTPFVMGGGPMWHYDACLKWTTIGAIGYGVALAGLLAEIENNSL